MNQLPSSSLAPDEAPDAAAVSQQRRRTFARLRASGLSESAILAMLPESWTRQVLSRREPNTGRPR